MRPIGRGPALTSRVLWPRPRKKMIPWDGHLLGVAVDDTGDDEMEVAIAHGNVRALKRKRKKKWRRRLVPRKAEEAGGGSGFVPSRFDVQHTILHMSVLLVRVELPLPMILIVDPRVAVNLERPLCFIW